MAKTRVFIVDDDPTFSKMLEHELKEAGWNEYKMFESGEDCLANLNDKPKLILLDFTLGGLNGLDVLKQIKETIPRTDVIMLTGLEDETVKEKCMAEGASNYILKDPDGLERFRNEIIPKYKKSGIFSFFR